MQELDRREIRVFISSTLVDFMEERDLLVKQVVSVQGSGQHAANSISAEPLTAA